MNTESIKWLKFRLCTILCLFLILFVALISRAFQLQILAGKDLRSIAQRQHMKTLQMLPERGIIFDRNGEKLAASVLMDSVCADPSKIRDPRAFANKMAGLLGVDRKLILKRISAGKNFCWIARRVAPEQAEAVESLKEEAVFIVKEPQRLYPNGELAGQILGFVGTESNGLEGLETRYDRYLKGTPQKLVWARDAKGHWLYPRVETVARTEDTATNMILTIDSRIQYLVETQLKAAVQEKGAKGGYAIAMNPQTGEILALANQPSFDPNFYFKGGPGHAKNRAVNDCFDPGSTFKPFLIAAALEEKVVREKDRVFCENGSYRVANRVIHEAQRKRRGSLSIREVVKYSSNIGCVKVSEKLGKEKFYEYIRAFGFGSKTGIDLPGESSGLLRPVSAWTRVDTSTIAFGQGISVTAVQLLTAMSAIANHGVLMKPYIVQALTDKKGRIIEQYSPTVVRNVISPETARTMTSILTSVVQDEDGTGKNARIAHLNVAGKTGTSQKFDFSRGVYSSEKVRTSFLGFFPAENPQIAILVTLDEPQRDKWGGVAAAPVFKKIGEQMLTCFKSYIKDPSLFVPEENIFPDPPKVKLVSATQIVPETTEQMEEMEMEDESTIPNFQGMTVREVLKKSRERGIELKINGSGWAVSQVPQAGVPIRSHPFCVVSFKTERE
ncbi:MAG TPA: penicillin-binding transpeptidase domain-containing protein [Syntrophales bacterium]|jgi:cell division protein FtsI (penicillin-binding protein 3)|nr:penicillin-binding transpeptidase domain-containing protein [Syntrophales bacterium]